ncbi:unnamed protein product [Amoebophrya sp. A120]|nr:unnamed protein product [Amoebophrya sp. A120]|eukprot:GSA120T00024835001.1
MAKMGQKAMKMKMMAAPPPPPAVDNENEGEQGAEDDDPQSKADRTKSRYGAAKQEEKLFRCGVLVLLLLILAVQVLHILITLGYFESWKKDAVTAKIITLPGNKKTPSPAPNAASVQNEADSGRDKVAKLLEESEKISERVSDCQLDSVGACHA